MMSQSLEVVVLFVILWLIAIILFEHTLFYVQFESSCVCIVQAKYVPVQFSTTRCYSQERIPR